MRFIQIAGGFLLFLAAAMLNSGEVGSGLVFGGLGLVLFLAPLAVRGVR